MNDVKKNPDELGALWTKQSARGDYMTGTINGEPVVLFKNDRKVEGDKQPTWRVLKSKPREERETVARPHPGSNDDLDFWILR
ncbi:MAG TPA: hypothetical protein VNJ04_11955 [Gemmatimonadaceae bacterium]|nr:hypothetical protein [Gemmatimonadaceae bacterium]